MGARKATQAASHAAVTVDAARPVIAARAWRHGRRNTSSASPTSLSPTSSGLRPGRLRRVVGRGPLLLLPLPLYRYATAVAAAAAVAAVVAAAAVVA